MSVTSISFVILSISVLAVYYLLTHRWQNYWLLFVSYVFCTTWSWQFALVLVLLTLVNYTFALILRNKDRGKPGLLWVGIVLNIIALVFFRTANFFLPDLISLLAEFGVKTGGAGLHILLPIGLSYYVLGNISYLVDVYRGQVQATKDIFAFGLYLAYFPKLLAGPIERARTFLPKIAQKRCVDNATLARNITLIAIGSFRKLVVADYLSSIIFWDALVIPAKYTAPELLGWLLMYAMILYNDFAGYTSIVRGVSGLFGIELASNFEQPYFARNFTEFWNRWHITLSHWLRDYIYFPISRALLRRDPSQWNLMNLVIPPIVTMLASGLWHGISLHMLVWGGLHGLYLVVDRIPSLWRPVVPPQRWPLWRQILGAFFVVSLVLIAWVPFGAELPVAINYWKAMLDWTNIAIRYRRLMVLIPLIAIIVCLDWLQRRHKDEVFTLRWPRLAQAALLASSTFLIFILTLDVPGEPFIYQGF